MYSLAGKPDQDYRKDVTTVDEQFKEYKLAVVQPLVGKTVKRVEYAPNSDEGFRIFFTDGTFLDFGFSGCEGTVFVDRE